MTHIPTEDDDFLVSSVVDDFAVSDEDALDDPESDLMDDQVEQLVTTQTVEEIKQYLKEAIAEQDSVDQLDMTEGAKIPLRQQVAVHKLVKQHLINIQTIIINKVKES